jgi:hypothetical protein
MPLYTYHYHIFHYHEIRAVFVVSFSFFCCTCMRWRGRQQKMLQYQNLHMYHFCIQVKLGQNFMITYVWIHT